jgi:hypothetical protein
MYIVPIAWIYVALMMAVAEATNSNGTVLGAIITFLLYGLGPVALVMYFMGSPSRRRAIKAKEAAELAERYSAQPDAGSQPAADAIAPVGKEP